MMASCVRTFRKTATALFALGCLRCGARSELYVEPPFDGGAPDTAAIDSGVADDASAPDSGPFDGSFVADTATPDAAPSDSSNATDSGRPISPAPQQIAPLSTSTVTSQTPRFHWKLAPGEDGAEIEVCSDRECREGQLWFSAYGTSTTAFSYFTPGVYYWRLRGMSQGAVGTDASPVWEFSVGARSATVDTSWGTTPDVNGDGFADVIVGASDPVTLPGGAYVYLGGSGGLSTTATSITSADDECSAFGESSARRVQGTSTATASPTSSSAHRRSETPRMCTSVAKAGFRRRPPR